MPLYDFKCPSCGCELRDELLPIDHDQPVCECGNEMKTLLGSFAYVYKVALRANPIYEKTGQSFYNKDTGKMQHIAYED